MSRTTTIGRTDPPPEPGSVRVRVRRAYTGTAAERQQAGVAGTDCPSGERPAGLIMPGCILHVSEERASELVAAGLVTRL